MALVSLTCTSRCTNALIARRYTIIVRKQHAVWEAVLLSHGVVLTAQLTTGSKHQVTWTIGANWQRTVSEHDPFSPNVLTWASLITSIVFTGHY